MINGLIESTKQVSLLDPFLLDEFFMDEFHHCNRLCHVKGIIRKGNGLELAGVQLQHISQVTAQAMTRDLGFLASSLVRHGASLNEVSGLEPFLMNISKISQEIPRDNLYSYTVRNPTGKRRRSFTGLDEELLFIELLTISIEEILKLLCLLPGREMFDPESQECAEALHSCAGRLEVLTPSIVTVKRKISPEVFSYKLRPYFEPLQVGGRSWVGQSAAQMPLLLIDWAVWGADCSDTDYRSYFEHNIEYSPAIIRDYQRQQGLTESYISLTEKALKGMSPYRAEAVATALLEILTVLAKFRYPHIKVAEENFSVRVRNTQGSGGYDMEILNLLAEYTQHNRARIKTALRNSCRQLINH
ncbi:DUF1864 family protein [Hahella sp. KA22]|uniref:monodechloroaminopyrrolnitrin synthase PrnB family protein n=1 Tax=Hahella sp. KA22 TaxID=1628392 RepID=UPI000FDD12E9|nr:monodechloroaminopyrrolnitrin synthase PrnB family protein [Hahella sp. KA22]AZZ90634.1 DUF1864 family protein [Hahella sp. KA22]QAY54005.1 DUF1864 family protein [Hahella sp. KA22]